MKSYSQSQEDLIILDYFDGFIGKLLSVGENDGTTFSNAKLLIDNGWRAKLIEPSSVFDQLLELHRDNPKVSLHNIAIGDVRSKMTFYESGNHVPHGKDKALVSTLDFEETIRWRNQGVEFIERIVDVVRISDVIGNETYEMITIDCEAYDWLILQQLDLSTCKLIILEWNSFTDLLDLYSSYCGCYGLKEIHRNAENILFALPK